ncbi:MAG: serine hydrolase domain-containing protein [Litoreibacter sp.]
MTIGEHSEMSGKTIHSHWISSSGREGFSGTVAARFPYWSFTKTVIAICALKLVEEGALDLDVPLDGQPYSLRQLLAHTSGLPDYCQLPEYGVAVSAGDPVWSKDKMLDIALSRGMLLAPDKGWSYSNIGYMVVGELIEAITAKTLGQNIYDMVCKPLGLQSVELAHTREQFGSLHWEAAAAYDPRWVYHGCLIGTAEDATRLLHCLFTGDVLQPSTLEQMCDAKSLGGAISGRPWISCGYALGLMSGAVNHAGRSIGHSGAGPFSVNAVYHFPDLNDPMTVASFTDGSDEGIAEFEAVKLALQHQR